MEILMLDTSDVVNDPSSAMIASGSPRIQGVSFCYRSAVMRVKVVAVRDENDVVVKEHDVLSESVVGSDAIFLTKNLQKS